MEAQTQALEAGTQGTEDTQAPGDTVGHGSPALARDSWAFSLGDLQFPPGLRKAVTTLYTVRCLPVLFVFAHHHLREGRAGLWPRLSTLR